MHLNVTIKNVSWPHFSWATLYSVHAWRPPISAIQYARDVICHLYAYTEVQSIKAWIQKGSYSGA